METEIQTMIVESNRTLNDNNQFNAEDLKICCPMDVTDSSIEEDERVRCTATITSISIRRVRVVVSLVGRLVLPAVAGVYYAYLRNRDTLLDSVKTQILPALITFLTNGLTKSLSSVQGAVTYPTNKIDPILKIIKLKYPKPLAIEPEESTNEIEEVPPKCVTCCVLSEPPSNIETKVDVVFIHGLHGSLVKTWKQGQWKMPKIISGGRRSSEISLREVETPNNPKGLKRCSSSPFHGPLTAKFAKDLQGDRRNCWCQDDSCMCNSEEEGKPGDEPYSECWPKDWLPKDCPDVRVIGITYTTDPYLWRPVWIKGQCRSSMEQRSSEMIEQLIQLGVGQRPIVWVGHSKGGLFVKQLLVDAWEKRESDLQLAAMCQNTKAIMFYSVPHRGSALADFTLPLIRKSVELLEIRKNCEKVLSLHDRFLSVLNDENFSPFIFSFIETSLTFMSFLYLRIVAIESADPGVGETCGVPLDHREICKPRGRDCFLYKQLVELINNVIEDNYQTKSITNIS